MSNRSSPSKKPWRLGAGRPNPHGPIRKARSARQNPHGQVRTGKSAQAPTMGQSSPDLFSLTLERVRRSTIPTGDPAHRLPNTPTLIPNRFAPRRFSPESLTARNGRPSTHRRNHSRVSCQRSSKGFPPEPHSNESIVVTEALPR